MPPALLILLWIGCVIVYWRALFQIVGGGFLDTQEKILWFLVITLAPLIGLITYWISFPPERRRKDSPGS